jgi:hypothetical protein
MDTKGTRIAPYEIQVNNNTSPPCVSRLSTKCGSLDSLQHSGPSRPVRGTGLTLSSTVVTTCIGCSALWPHFYYITEDSVKSLRRNNLNTYLCRNVFNLVFVIPRPPLWSSGQSSWLQIQRSRVWEVLGLERDPLSLVNTIEELLGRNSSGSGLEIREYGRVDPLCWPRDTLNRKSWH